MDKPAFYHCQSVCMSKPYMLVALLYAGLYRSTSPADVKLATLTGYAVNPCSPQSQVILHRTEEAGDFPRCHPNILDVESGQHPAEAAICHLDVMEAERLRSASLSALNSNHRVEGTSYLLQTIPIFTESGSTVS